MSPLGLCSKIFNHNHIDIMEHFAFKILQYDITALSLVAPVYLHVGVHVTLFQRININFVVVSPVPIFLALSSRLSGKPKQFS